MFCRLKYLQIVNDIKIASFPSTFGTDLMFSHAELSILLLWTWEAKPLACRCYCEDGRRAVEATKDLEGSLNASAAAPHNCYFLHWLLLGVSRNRGNDQNCPKRLKRRWRRWVCICKCIKIPAHFSAGSDASAQFSGFATTFPHSTHNSTYTSSSPPLYLAPPLLPTPTQSCPGPPVTT